MSRAHVFRARRGAVGLAVFTAAAVAAAWTAGPAGARVQQEITVTTEPQLVTFPPFPQSAENSTLAFAPNPDDCRTFDFCDTIPLRVPIPDIGPGDDYRMILSLEWDDQGESQPLEFHLYDDGQTKEQYGSPQPGDQGYEPRETPYTRLRSSTDPKDEDILVGQPDLVEYNLVVVNTAGQNTGYGVRTVILTEEFSAPPERLPPSPGSPSGGGGFSGSLGGSTAEGGGLSSDGAGSSTGGTGESSSTLGDVDAISDPDLIAIQEDNLEQALSAPTPLSAGPVEAGPPPEPPSGLTLFLWIVVVPAALLGGSGALVMRRRRLVLAYG